MFRACIGLARVFVETRSSSLAHVTCRWPLIGVCVSAVTVIFSHTEVGQKVFLYYSDVDDLK